MKVRTLLALIVCLGKGPLEHVSKQQEGNRMKNLLGLMVMVVVVVSCSFSKKEAANSNSTANSNNATKTETSTATNGAGLTRAKYEQIQFGMTYDEVAKILGPGIGALYGKLSRSCKGQVGR